MSATEGLLRILSGVEGCIPSIVVTAIATTIVLVILLLMTRGEIWIDQPRMKVVSIFAELGGRGMLSLACAWVKLIILLTFLVQFDKMTLPDYLFFLLPGIIYCLNIRSVLRIPVRVFWLVFQLVALGSTNLICSYILDIDPGMSYVLLYILLALFVALFGIYSFLMELSDISFERRVNL